MSRPMATPAMVACTPDIAVNAHAAMPSATYSGTHRTPSRISSQNAMSDATAAASHAPLMPPE